jgi:aminopeptidase N
MRKPLQSIIFVSLLTLIMASCSLIGVNFSGKVPKSAGSIPSFTRKDSLHGALSPLRTCFDVTFYHLAIKPDPKTKTISGKVEMTFQIKEPCSAIQIDLAERMEIKGIWDGDTELKFSREFSAVKVQLGKVSEVGGTKTLTIVYSGKPQSARKPPWEGGLVWKKDKNKNPWIGVACEDEGASIWWPLKDHMSDEPDSVRVSIEVPKGLKGISNGRLVEVLKKEESDVWVWQTSYPVNLYNITFYVGDFSKITIPYKTKELEFYALPYSVEKAKEHFKQTIAILEFFENSFGEYPWWNDGFKMVESPFEGMEHQTAIAYGNAYKNSPPYNFDYIILHEIAHEWWGNSLTANDMSELWLHEGFATYSEAMYVEEKFGYNAYLNYLLMYRIEILNKRPIIGPMDVHYTNYKDGDMYIKGAWFLHSLRFAIGNDTLFNDIIKTFAIENRMKSVTTSDFLELVNRKTTRNYTWLFEQYLYQRESPVLVYQYKSGNGKNTVNYYWENTVDGFNLPLLFKFEYGEKWVIPTREIQSLDFEGNILSIPYYPYYFGSRKVKKIKAPK